MKGDNMFYDQLKKIANENNTSLAKIVESVGITQATVSHYKSGRSKPNTDILVKIAITYNKSIDWLLEDELKKYKESI